MENTQHICERFIIISPEVKSGVKANEKQELRVEKRQRKTSNCKDRANKCSPAIASWVRVTPEATDRSYMDFKGIAFIAGHFVLNMKLIKWNVLEMEPLFNLILIA